MSWKWFGGEQRFGCSSAHQVLRLWMGTLLGLNVYVMGLERSSSWCDIQQVEAKKKSTDKPVRTKTKRIRRNKSALSRKRRFRRNKSAGKVKRRLRRKKRRSFRLPFRRKRRRPRRRQFRGRTQQMVVSAHPLATHAALRVLKRGGNAVDAAITAAFVLAVVEPYSAGIGGGGFMLIYDARRRKIRALDFRERAPLKADAQMYARHGIEKAQKLSQEGHLA
ncbi:MAG: gamma-glutamyltransferase, partial [Myxococcota bacterium]